jgi:hypothetical protein
MSSSEYITHGSAIRGWRKSSYSGGGNGECLEVADGHPSVPVRDSKYPHGPALLFPSATWSSFVTGIKTGGLTI